MVYTDLGFADHFAHWHTAELQREAANDQLASLARLTSGPRQPWRAHIASWLYAAAGRLDGQPRPVARAEA